MDNPRPLLPIFALFALFLASCSGSSSEHGRVRTVNFLPDTRIDSLYVSYLASDGPRRVSDANALLAAIADETADSLVQFPVGVSVPAMDAVVSYWMGEYFCYSSRFPEAEQASLRALDNAAAVPDSSFVVEIHSLLGLVCQRMGRNEDALRYLRLCYDASSRSGSLADQSSDLGNLAAVALALRNPALARSYIDRAVAIERRLGRDAMLAIRLGIASEVYQSLGLYDPAEAFAREAYALDRDGGRPAKAAIRLSQLAAVLIARGRPDDAVPFLLEAVQPLRDVGNSYSLAVVENQLGSVYLQKGQPSLAADHFRVAASATASGGNLLFRQRALAGLAEALRASDPDSAFSCLALSAQIADSVFRLNNSRELAVIEQKYTESEALRLSERRAYDRKVQIYALVALLSLALLAISVLFFVIRAKNRGQRVLRSLEKMRSDFFTNVTHEFRTPITVILGLSADIADDPSASRDVRAAARVISAQGSGMLDLVNQLLDISKVRSAIGTPDWRRGNIVSFMHMVAEKYVRTASNKGVDLVFSPSQNVVEMDFIPQYVHKILHNLVSNALKFTPKGGRIFISTNIRDSRLLVRIADTGAGIDPADLPRIFEPYYQGANSSLAPGTGIGLSLVDRMVSAMGGTVSVKSVPGKGSVFTLSFPLVHEGGALPIDDDDASAIASSALVPGPLPAEEVSNAGEPAPHAPAVAESAPAESKPIALVVEDNPDVAAYIGSHLSPYAVHYARNGREGLEKAKDLIPDVIVTDLLMPEMDGLEMTRCIRADASVSHIPVIVITAKADDSDRVAALRTGVDAYLVKPFCAEELEARASQLIRQRRMLCEKYQRAIAAGSVDVDALPIADRLFISNVVGIVYDMLAKGESVDLDVIAARLSMSPRSFSRKFMALTGDSPTLYVNKIKVSKAKSVIDADPRVSLSDVAYLCGFDNPNYFSRIFRQIEGVSPTAYRRRVR